MTWSFRCSPWSRPDVPVAVRWRQQKWRLIDVETGRIATTKKGTAGEPIDKGGGASEKVRRDLERQARAINASLAERRAKAAVKASKQREAARILAARYKRGKKRKR